MTPSMEVITTNTTATFATDSGLNDGTDHTYLLNEHGDDIPSSSLTAQATTLPNAPTNLTATPSGTNQVKLKWNHITKSPKTVTFELIDTLKSAPGGMTSAPVNATKVDATTYTVDLTLAPGSMHEFQVVAMVKRFDDSPMTPQTVESLPSNVFPMTVPVVPPAVFRTVFTTDLTTDQPGVPRSTLVQRFSNAVFDPNPFNGNFVRITVSGPAGAGLGLRFDRIYISRAGAPDRFDSLAPATPGQPAIPGQLTKVVDIDSGDQPVILAGGDTPKILPAVAFEFDHVQDLIIAFDISGGQGDFRMGTFTGAEAYSTPGPAQAAMADRGTGFGPGTPNAVWFVTKIEVA
jgi:hypothetical protein